MSERPEYRCERMEDSEDCAKIAAHYDLNEAALRAARKAQTGLSALGLAGPIAAYAECDDESAGRELERLEADMLTIHDALVEVGLEGAINAGSIIERIEQLAGERKRREAMSNVERAARELDALFDGHPGEWTLGGQVIDDGDVSGALLSLHDYLNDVTRERSPGQLGLRADEEASLEPLGTCVIHGDYWSDDCYLCHPPASTGEQA